MKNNKGITLIALVVTIIVLLILAGVSIAMLTGENGILKRASDAGESTAVANAKEKVTLAINEAITNYYKDTYTGSETTATTLYSASKTALDKLKDVVESGATITVAESKDTPKKTTETKSYKGASKATGTLASDGTFEWAK